MNVDLFAGPGGWEQGARLIGLEGIVGYEWDEAACQTAEAAGFPRVRGDVSLKPVPLLVGEIASPPCQAWSIAGKGLGKLDRPRIMRHLDRIREARRWLNYSREGWHDERSPLVFEPVRWALLGSPQWIACEQVPAVLPFWQAFGSILADHGYHWDAGILSAEQYGVPQTRKRAILVAVRQGWNFATLPTPTHGPYRKGKPYASELPRWFSMADALGWGFDAEPSATVSGGGTSTGGAEPFANADYRKRLARFGNQPNSATRHVDEPAATVRYSARASAVDWIHEAPATTVQGDRRIAPRGHHERQFNGETVRVTVQEAAVLQSFPPDYPWHGTKTKQYEQIGNAIPPRLAAAILGNLLGMPWRHVCEASYIEIGEEAAA